MSGTYPTASYLHRIGYVHSSQCTYCTQGVVETLTHFMCVCPRFREARTAGHNKAFAQVSAFIKTTLSSDWQLYIETQLGCTGLQLAIVLINDVETSVRRWQPDAVAISWSRKRIGIIEFSRPADLFSNQLTAAHSRKVEKYRHVKLALQYYSKEGWEIEILPWIVGIHGLIQVQCIQTAVDFLLIPKSKWQAAVECTVLASVESLAFMNRARFSSNKQNRVFKTDDPISQTTQNEGLGRKRPRTSSTGDVFQTTRLKWQRMATNQRRQT